MQCILYYSDEKKSNSVSEQLRIIKEKLHCPRCKSRKLIDYGETFDCPICNLEFEKKDFETFDDESAILSIEEKLEIIKVLDTDSKKEKEHTTKITRILD